LTDRFEEDVPNRWLFVRLPYQMTAEMTAFAEGASLLVATAEKYGIMQDANSFFMIPAPMSRSANLAARM